MNFRCNTKTFDCVRNFDENYRFYASFENTLCTDYITEKTYKVLEKNLIPLVYVGVNIEHFLPPKSYINVADFPSIKNLTDYLIHLSENPMEYIQYFWWKRYYKVQSRDKHSPDNFCTICKFLHEKHKETRVYKNFGR